MIGAAFMAQAVPTLPMALLGLLPAWISVAACISSLLSIAAACAAVAPRAGVAAADWIDYFALRRPAWRSILLWSLLLFAFNFLAGWIFELFHLPVTPDAVFEIVNSAASLPLLYIAVCIAAPISEEVLFRGLLLFSFEGRRRRQAAGVVISGALFASLHLQYEWYYLIVLFIVGLLLGAARMQSRSIWTSVAMHALNNAWAMFSVTGLGAGP